MRCLIISDLHSNWEALEAVLDHARGQFDQIVCCGDLVGYGPDPNRVIDWARQSVDTAIRGNHDRVCCGLDDLEWFNPAAQAAARWTMSQLSAENMVWLRGLSQGPATVHGFVVAHGSTLDEDEYVTSLSDAANLFEYLESTVTFFGHTHLQGGFSSLGGKQQNIWRPEVSRNTRHVRIEPEGLYLINPGSVGQPRDGDPRAAYALYDSESRDLDLLRVDYDFAAVRRKIERTGMPPTLGERLAYGV